MDMSGAMPTRAYVEIYGAAGELLATVESRITGGQIQTELPGFPPGTRGRIREVWIGASDAPVDEPALDQLELVDLPTDPVTFVSQVG